MKKKPKTKLKVDDVVLVIAGKDKGKTGKILNLVHDKERILVEGVNQVKKTVKKSEENKTGGINVQEAPIHISNVMYYDKNTKRGSRIGLRRTKDNKSERFFKGQAKKKGASA